MSKKKIISTSALGLASSVLAFLGVVSCCGFPVLAAVLAWFGIGASQLGVLAEYRTLFVTIAVISLLYGFYTVYFKQSKTKSSCCDTTTEEESTESCCNSSAGSGWFAKLMLWIGVFAVGYTLFANQGNDNNESNCCTPEQTEIKQENTQKSCCGTK